MSVLFYVNRNPGSNKTEVIASGEGRNLRTRFERIRDLIDAGLIEADSGNHHNTMHLHTTPLGRRLCTAMELVLEDA